MKVADAQTDGGADGNPGDQDIPHCPWEASHQRGGEARVAKLHHFLSLLTLRGHAHQRHIDQHREDPYQGSHLWTEAVA